jgi:hypothetical protein
MLNNFIGDLNKQYIKKTKGATTLSHATAMSLWSHYKSKGKDIKLYEVGTEKKAFFLRLNHREQLYSGHVPIWRHIIAMTYINLDKLYRTVVGPNTKVIAYKVDSIKVINPLPLDLNDKEDCLPGEIHEEEPKPPKGYLMKELVIPEKYVYVKPEWKEVPEDVKFLKRNSCMCKGVAGAGKTEANKNSSVENTLCLSFTNKAVDVCKERGIENTHTLSSYFGETHDQRQKAIKALGNIVIPVHIDEFSMTPNKFFRYLLQVKRINPKIKFVIFGDPNQCPPPEDGIWFDYMESKLIMHLCDYNLMTLSYKNTRYDAKTYEALNYFIQHKKLPDCMKGRKLLSRCDTNISYLNSTRHKVNGQCLINYCKKTNEELLYVGKRKDSILPREYL